MRTLPKRVLRAAARGGRRFARNNGMVYSAAVAFNILLSAIPVLFLVFAATALLIGRDELPFRELAEIFRKTFPYGAQVLIANVRKLFQSGAAFGVVGSILLVLSSFSATAAVHTSLAVMMGTPRRRQLLRGAAFHVALVLTLIVITAAVIVIPPLWKGLSFLPVRIPRKWDAALGLLVEIVSDVVLMGIVFVGSAMSYRYLSPRPVRFRNAFAGALAFCALLFPLKFGLSFYIRKFSRLSLIYGSLFRIVSFIIVAYLFAAAYLYCASIIGMLESEEGGDAAIPGEGTGAGGNGAPGGD